MATGIEIIDLHSHLLPDVDDGPACMADSLAICESYVSHGIRTVVATPHMADERMPVAAGHVLRTLDRVREACADRGLDVDLLPGAEVRLHPELEAALAAGSVLSLGGSGRYVMIELPMQPVVRVGGLVRRLARAGVLPVLAHAERVPAFWQRRPQRLAALVEQGCLVQVTAGSLAGVFGRRPRGAARRWLDAGLVHFVASDLHAPGDARSDAFWQAGQMLRDSVGEAAAFDILCANPARVAEGRPFDARHARWLSNRQATGQTTL